MPVGRLGRLVIALRNAEGAQDFDRGLDGDAGGDRLVKRLLATVKALDGAIRRDPLTMTGTLSSLAPESPVC